MAALVREVQPEKAFDMMVAFVSALSDTSVRDVHE